MKDYKLETLFQAVGLADKYLASIVDKGIEAPCLVNVAVTSVLMAAKLEEAIQPCFDIMINLLN